MGVGLFFLAVAAEAHGVGWRQDVVGGKLKKPEVPSLLPLPVRGGLAVLACAEVLEPAESAALSPAPDPR